MEPQRAVGGGGWTAEGAGGGNTGASAGPPPPTPTSSWVSAGARWSPRGQREGSHGGTPGVDASARAGGGEPGPAWARLSGGKGGQLSLSPARLLGLHLCEQSAGTSAGSGPARGHHDVHARWQWAGPSPTVCHSLLLSLLPRWDRGPWQWSPCVSLLQLQLLLQSPWEPRGIPGLCSDSR